MGMGLLSCCEKPKEDSLKKLNLDKDESVHSFLRGGVSNSKLNNINNSNSISKSNNYIENSSLIHQTEDYLTIKKIFFFFSKFEMIYKYYDDFGLTFDPLLNFKVNTFIEKTYSQKIEDDGTGGKNDQTNDGSFNEVSYAVKNITGNNLSSGLNTPNTGAEGKMYTFEASEVLDVSEFKNWPNKKVKITIFNKNKFQQYNTVQVGFCHVPLTALFEDGLIEGKFPIRNKMIKEVGYVYMRIKCLENDQEPFNGIINIDGENNFENMGEDFNINDKNTNLFFGINDNIVDFYPMLTSMPFEEIDEILQNHFRLKKIDVLMNIKQSEKGWDEKKSRIEQEKVLQQLNSNPQSAKDISDLLFESIMKQQHILIYGVLNYLISRISKRDTHFLDEFLDLVNSFNKEINIFNTLIEIFPTNNLVLIKQYCFFFFKLIELYREIEIETEAYTTKLNFEEMFKITLDSFGHLHFILEKIKDFEYEEIEEIREIVYWLLNNMLNLVTPNLADKIIKVDTINHLYSIAFNNCILLITKPKYIIEVFTTLGSDSEITALIVKVFRKAIQILLDDKNNFVQNSDRPKLVSIGIKDLLINEEKANTFLVFIQMCLTRYVNYPEIFSNILLILIYFCMDYKYPEIVRKILDNVEISLLCSGFDMYRGNLKKIGKNINYFFYKLISHITELNKSFEEEESVLNFKPSEVKEICNEFTKLFRMKQTGKDSANFEKSKNLITFIKNKNLELHEILCCISANITKNSDACKIICKDKCYFIQHIIEYFFDLNRDSIKKYLDKYKHNKKEKVTLYISIIDNSLLTFDNLITRSTFTKDFYMKFLNKKNLTKNKVKYHITDLLDTAATCLSNNNQKLKKTAEYFIQNFE